MPRKKVVKEGKIVWVGELEEGDRVVCDQMLFEIVSTGKLRTTLLCIDPYYNRRYYQRLGRKPPHAKDAVIMLGNGYAAEYHSSLA